MPGDPGRSVEGLLVSSREEALARYGPDMPVVNCVYRADVTLPQIVRGLRASGFRYVWSLPHIASAFADLLPSIYGFGALDLLETDRPRIMSAWRRLADDGSRETFASLVDQRVTLDFSEDRIVDPAIYFPDFLPRDRLSGKDRPFVFVDCGAYVGDTVEALATWGPGPGARVVALEPDPASFLHLTKVAAEHPDLNVCCVQAAAGASNGNIGFVSLGNEASRVAAPGEGEESVRMVTVDTALAECGVRASYIKYDVEGFERDALAGSSEAILRDHAALAVSVYHRPNDLWDLLLMLDEIEPSYAFHLREHGPDGVDTVLYALPA